MYKILDIPSERLTSAFWAYQFIIFSTMISIVQVPYRALLIAHEKMHIFAYIGIIEAILKLLIVYILFVIAYDKLIAYAILIFLVSICITAFYKYYAVKNYKESHFRIILDKETIKSMLHFSGWNTFSIIGWLLKDQGINIILNIFAGPIAVAARTVSLQITNGIIQISNGFQEAVTPQITKLYASNRINELNNLLYKNAKYSFLLVWFIVLPLLIELQNILNIWLTNIPENTYIFSILGITYALVFSIHRPFILAIHAIGKVKETNITSSIILILLFPLSYILLQNDFPLYSPLILVVVSTLLSFCIDLYYLNRWIKINIVFLMKHTIQPIAIVAVLSLITNVELNSLLSLNNKTLEILINLIISFCSALLFIYFFALDNLERIKIKSKFFEIRMKKS